MAVSLRAGSLGHRARVPERPRLPGRQPLAGRRREPARDAPGDGTAGVDRRLPAARRDDDGRRLRAGPRIGARRPDHRRPRGLGRADLRSHDGARAGAFRLRGPPARLHRARGDGDLEGAGQRRPAPSRPGEGGADAGGDDRRRGRADSRAVRRAHAGGRPGARGSVGLAGSLRGGQVDRRARLAERSRVPRRRDGCRSTTTASRRRVLETGRPARGRVGAPGRGRRADRRRRRGLGADPRRSDGPRAAAGRRRGEPARLHRARGDRDLQDRVA